MSHPGSFLDPPTGIAAGGQSQHRQNHPLQRPGRDAARVGNYPGVTVETKKGQMTQAGRTFDLIDLPGTYSLAAQPR